MQMDMTINDLEGLVAKQLNALFQFSENTERGMLKEGVHDALKRSEVCFAGAAKKSKYFCQDGQIYFNPFHSGQYTIFLYFLSHSIALRGADWKLLADRIYYLNKALNGLDLFYEVEMPKVFFLDHPVGTVMGRAKYGEFFSFSQCCTVGNNRGSYPIIGQNVLMHSGSKIVGNCCIGDNVVFSANTYVIDTDIPSCSLVFGASPNLVIKQKDISFFDSF